MPWVKVLGYDNTCNFAATPSPPNGMIIEKRYKNIFIHAYCNTRRTCILS